MKDQLGALQGELKTKEVYEFKYNSIVKRLEEQQMEIVRLQGIISSQDCFNKSNVNLNSFIQTNKNQNNQVLLVKMEELVDENNFLKQEKHKEFQN